MDSLDIALKNAGMALCDEWVREIDDRIINHEPHEFSKHFERKMKRLIRQHERMTKWGRFYMPGKRIAVAIILILIGAFGITMSVEAYREAFLKTVIKVKKDLTEYWRTPVGNVEDMYEKLDLSIGYLPEGFKKETIGQNEYYEMSQYTNGSSNFVLIAKLLLIGSQETEGLDTENATIRHEIIGETEYLICTKNDTCSILWDDKNISYTLIGNIGEDELKNIAASIENNVN